MLNKADQAQIIANVYLFFRDAQATVNGLPNSELVDGDIPNTAIIRKLVTQQVKSSNKSVEDIQETVSDILRIDFGYRHISRELDLKEQFEWDNYSRSRRK